MLKNSIRMLAAIMFTDMVGFTAMMQENEQQAKELRDRLRNVLDEFIFSHQGRILQFYGDGTLSIFGSALEAVKCAVEIQQELQKDPKVPLRIGIHMGDIVYDDDGVYGDGVNIASRIESLAVSGSVLISDKVYDEVSNHPMIKVKSLGYFNLKNVKKPVAIYCITGNGLVIPSKEALQGRKGSAEKKSIAVLPFVNMSEDPENEYFSDGVTEELLTALSKVDGLQVTSRTSSFAFKGLNEDIREIGKKLNVKTVLEGSVRKFRDRVRITAQLINTADGYHVWSEVYDRKIEDIFELQDEISRKIANTLREKLTSSKIHEPLVTSGTKNFQAYNLYLRGKYCWNKWTPPAIKQGLKFFEEAIDLDPEFTQPYAGLSNCYIYLGSTGYLRPKIAYPKAKEYALRALKLDPNMNESIISLGVVQLFYDWDWTAAKKSFTRALELYPASADAHYTYSLYLTAMCELSEAIVESETAVKLDPLSLPLNNNLGHAYFNAGRYRDALEQFNKTLELEPNFRAAVANMGWTYFELGDINKAIETFEKFRKLTQSEYGGLAPLGFLYAAAGRIQDAQQCIKRLEQRELKEEQMALHMDFAVIYAGLKNYDKVFEYLEKAFEEKLGGLIFMNSVPGWREVRKDSRFNLLMKRMNMPGTVN